MNNFYVYMYMDQDNIPFYVGKGNRSRFCISGHLSNRQSFLEYKIKKIGVDNVKVHFLHKNLAETEAFSWEKYWIKYFGRRDNGTGQLVNLTDGGEGNSGKSKETCQKISESNKGKKHSKETRQKMSEAKKGNQYAKGFIHSEETKEKISKALKGENNPNYGKKYTEEEKRKISETMKGRMPWNKGKFHSKETISKMSEIKQGKNNPMYGVYRKGKDAPMYGKKHSIAALQKMSIAKKLYWAKKKNDREYTDNN